MAFGQDTAATGGLGAEDPCLIWPGACTAGSLRACINDFGVPKGDVPGTLRTAIASAMLVAP